MSNCLPTLLAAIDMYVHIQVILESTHVAVLVCLLHSGNYHVIHRLCKL